MTSSLHVELFRSNCDRTFVQYFLAQLDMVVFIKMALTLSIRFRSRSFICLSLVVKVEVEGVIRLGMAPRPTDLP